MRADPKEMLDRFGDKSYLKDIICDARRPPSTAEANETLVASLIYLAENIRREGESARLHARGLKWATWALVFATLVLGGLALVQLLTSA
jgi:hypothetical protein